MNKTLKFFTYNNAVPIAVSILILGGGSVFAATNPDAVLSQEQKVITVDNTYIATKDLAGWSPSVNITAVTEDTDNYYVAYTLSTIDVKEYIWQDIMKSNSITVSKADLGDRDLGLYVTDLLKNVVDNESSYLAQVQQKEKANITQKTVATSYGGLVGKFLDDTTETLPGYTPVIPLPVAAPADPATPIAVVEQPAPQQPIDQQVDTLLAESQAAAAAAAAAQTAVPADTSTPSNATSTATSTPVIDVATSTATTTAPAVIPEATSTPAVPTASSTPPAATSTEPTPAPASEPPAEEAPTTASTTPELSTPPASQATTTEQ